MNLKIEKKIRKYFHFDKFSAIFKKEIVGGISTFLAMAYILAVNPAIVGAAPIGNGSFALNYQGGLFLATAISSFFATFAMGLYARIPVALAPGMGLNAFFAYTISQQVGFNSAMTITILSGLCYFILVITPAREKMAQLLPNNLKLAIGSGIGFFVAYVGLQNAKIIVKDKSDALVSTLGNFGDPLVILALVLLVVALVLYYSKIQGSIIITMILGAVILIPMIAANVISNFSIDKINPAKIGYGDLSTFENVAASGWLGFSNISMWKNPITYVGVLSFLYMDFFDTTGTLITIDKTIDLSKNDKKWLVKANYVDALSTIAGASIGATTVTSFVESTVGVAAGARTGFSAIITSLCFGVSIALWPVMQIFMPINGYQPITGPILILVGTMMISQLKYFEWEIIVDIPMLFITIIMMMLTNSIAYGICFGVLAFVILNVCSKLVSKFDKRNEKDKNSDNRLNIALVIICIISIIYIVLQTGITHYQWFL